MSRFDPCPAQYGLTYPQPIHDTYYSMGVYHCRYCGRVFRS